MKIFLLKTGVLLLFVGITYAIPTSSKQAQEISISLSPEEWNTVLEGLGELPMKKSLPVQNKMMQQFQAKFAPVQQPKKDSSINKTKKQ